MKKLQYTLIELLVAMSIFIIMIGLLFNIFVNASTVVVDQSTKVSILSDASVFFNYLTKDLANISLNQVPHFLDKDNNQTDPETLGSVSLKTTSDPLKIETASNGNSLIAFRSNVEYYHDPSYSLPYVYYDFTSSTGQITRRMREEEIVTSISADMDAIILDGVEKIEIKAWNTGSTTALASTTFATKPDYITIRLTLRTPNPNASAEAITQSLRTVNKTIYLNR